jgi:MFS family permease
VLRRPARLCQRADNGDRERALPIYPQYRERWGFSVTMLIFAVYVAGLLGALLTVGSLSDHLGRRPVLAATLLVAAASTAIF